MTKLPAHFDFRASPWPTPLGLQPPSDMRVFGDPAGIGEVVAAFSNCSASGRYLGQSDADVRTEGKVTAVMFGALGLLPGLLVGGLVARWPGALVLGAAGAAAGAWKSFQTQPTFLFECHYLGTEGCAAFTIDAAHRLHAAVARYDGAPHLLRGALRMSQKGISQGTRYTLTLVDETGTQLLSEVVQLGREQEASNERLAFIDRVARDHRRIAEATLRPPFEAGEPIIFPVFQTVEGRLERREHLALTLAAGALTIPARPLMGGPGEPRTVAPDQVKRWKLEEGNHRFELNDGATFWFPTEDVSNVDILTQKLTTLGFRRAN